MKSRVMIGLENRKLRSFNFWLILVFALCFPVSALFAEEEIVYDAQDRRDPFMALVTPEGRLINPEPAVRGEEKIVIGGIYYEENGNSYAIINGEVVGTGDYILGYTVLSIDKNKVTLRKGEQSVEYVLEKEEL